MGGGGEVRAGEGAVCVPGEVGEEVGEICGGEGEEQG